MSQEEMDIADKENESMKKHLRSIIEIARSRNIQDIYKDTELFFWFHSICVTNVIFRTKARKGRCVDPYYVYTDESDEAFAFLVLLNNANRIEDMADPDKDKDEWRQPLFTEATNSKTYKEGRTGEKLIQGKGWTKKAILQFADFQTTICSYRKDRKEEIEKLGREVLDLYREKYSKHEEESTENNSLDTQNRNEEDEEKRVDEFFRISAKRRRIGDSIAVATVTEV